MGTNVALTAAQLLQRTDEQLEARGQIEALQTSLLQNIEDGTFESQWQDAGTEEGERQLDHYWGDGVYARSLLIPKDVCVVGRLHKQARICMIMSGECTFMDEFQKQTVKAPWIGEFKAGTKTVVYAHEDTQWVAVVGTDLTDSAEAFNTLTTANLADYEEFLGLQCTSGEQV